MEENKQLSQEEYMEYIEKFKEDNKEDYETGKIRKVFTKCLPKKGKFFNWQESIGKIIFFIYQDIEGQIEIVDYINGEIPKLKLKYIKKELTISLGDFKNAKIGGLIGKINRQDAYKVDDIIEIRTGKVKIIKIFKKEVNGNNRKYYQYECLECGNIDKATGHELKEGLGCNVCCKYTRKVVKDINSIWKLRPDLTKYFIDIEDTYMYSAKSNDYVKCICPECGHKKEICISNLYTYGFCCEYCGDSISYPEKVMRNILMNTEISFDCHRTFNWSKNIQTDNPKLCGNKEYDFSFKLNSEQYIVETHGMQHYEEGFGRIKSNKKVRNLAEEKENDEIKKQIALDNGILEKNYIVVNCKYSKIDFIKSNILDSNLNGLFDLKIINWNKVDIESQRSLFLEVIKDWNKNNINVKQLAEKYLLVTMTIRNYLHRANSMNLLTREYNSKQELRKNGKRNGSVRGNNIKVILSSGTCRNFNSFKEAQYCLGINRDTLKNLYSKGKAYESKFSNNGYVEYLDGLIVVSV